jgi:hypothetical protein
LIFPLRRPATTAAINNSAIEVRLSVGEMEIEPEPTRAGDECVT